MRLQGLIIPKNVYFVTPLSSVFHIKDHQVVYPLLQKLKNCYSLRINEQTFS
jgi:hypothetical protein